MFDKQEKQLISKTNHSTCVSELIGNWLEELGIKEVFVIPGSHIDPLCRRFNQNSTLTLIIACHELGAGFMADGYARASLGKAVCMTIGGPGTAYVLASAVTSRVDSSPVLYLTGEPPHYLKEMLPFQDSGDLGTRDKKLFKSAINHSYFISESDNPFEVIKKVENVLKKNIPVNLSIPMDVQELKLSDNWKPFHYTQVENTIFYEWIDELAEVINKSKFPVLLIGNRFIQKNSAEILLEFVNTLGIPVATTFSSKGILPESHPLSLGNFGFAGSELSHQILFDSDCDLLILVGTDLGQRETFDWDIRLKPNGRTVINIDSKTDKPKGYPIVDHDYVVDSFNHLLLTLKPLLRSHSISIPENVQNTESSDKFSWKNITQVIREKSPENTVLFVDSGIHRTAAGIYWKSNLPYSFFSSDKIAPMGWAIGAAIGGKMARPHDPVIVFTGDGCMRMHGMEIATAARYAIPVIFVVFNNASYASIDKRLKTELDKELIADLPTTNWVSFGNVLGVSGSVVSSLDELKQGLEDGLNSNLPYILDVRISKNELVQSSTLPKALWPLR